MLLTLLFAIPILLIGVSTAYTLAKIRARNKLEASPANRPHSDQALQFYGFSNSCIPLKDGGVSVIVEVKGFDFESADDAQKVSFASSLGETIRTITANRGGDADAGVSLSFYGQAGQLDPTELLENIERAVENTAEPGIAAQALLDAQLLQTEAAARPFTHSRFAVVITLSAASTRREMQTAQNQLLAQSPQPGPGPGQSGDNGSSFPSSYQYEYDYNQGQLQLSAPDADRRFALTGAGTGTGTTNPGRGRAKAIKVGSGAGATQSQRTIMVAGWNDPDEANNYSDDSDSDDPTGTLSAKNAPDAAQQARLRAETERRLRIELGEVSPEELEAEEAELAEQERDRLAAEREKARLYRPSLWRRFVGTLGEGWTELSGSVKAAQVELGGSIAGHPVPLPVAEVLAAKANIMIGFCAKFGMEAHIMGHQEAYELIAGSLYLPKKPLVYYESVITHEIKCLSAINRLIEANPTLPTRDLEAAIAHKLEELELAQRKQRADQRRAGNGAAFTNSLAAILGGTNGDGNGNGGGQGEGTYNANGYSAQTQTPIDVSAFGTAPLDFEVDYVRVGVAPSIARLQATLRQHLERFQLGGRQPYQAVRYIRDIVENNGRLQSWPRESYLATLYIADWPNTIEIGALRSLLTQPGLELSVNVTIKTYNRKKAEKSLKRVRRNIRFGTMVDKKIDDGDRALVEAAAAQLTGAVVGSRGIINMVGVFVVVRADNPAQLYSAVRQIAGLLSGQGIELAECSYQQALGLFSAIPVGKNHIADTPLTGIHTLRNMLPVMTACFWPALIKDKLAGPLLVGTDDNAALVTTGDEGLLNPHEMIVGASGSGKTVSELIELIRRLYSFPKTYVRFIDPQNLAAQVVREVDGQVADMGPHGGIRYNFLWRFSLGGRPQPLVETYEIFSSSLSLMLERPLSDGERPTLNEQLIQLYQHFEGGRSLVRPIMEAIYYQHGQELGFFSDPTGRLYYDFEDKYTAALAEVRQRQNVPHNGFVVQPLFNNAGFVGNGSNAGSSSTDSQPNYQGQGQVVMRQYQLPPDYYQQPPQQPQQSSQNQSQGQKQATKQRARQPLVSEVGVALQMLNCVQRQTGTGTGAAAAKRNLYAGGGYSQVEIPLAEWQDIAGAVAAQKAWGQLDRAAWTNFLMVRYLSEPANPRRPAGQAEWVWWDEEKATITRSLTAPRRMEKSGHSKAKGQTGEKREAPWSYRLQLPGATLKWESGPIWYAEDQWGTLLKADLWRGLIRRGLLDRLHESQREVVVRDLLVELSYGEPILENILPLLYSVRNNFGPLGALMALTLDKIYCNPDDLGPLFNGYSNVNSDSRFLVFSVKDLSGNLLALRMMQCIELTWREIASTPRWEGRQYIIAWDELGTIMALPGGDKVGRYIGITYKRARALGGKIVCLEQNWQTFMSAAGQFIKDNSGVIKLMRQFNVPAANYWAREYGLSIEDRDRLLKCDKGEVLILRNQGSRTTKTWARYRAEPTQLKILSTNPDDRLDFIERRREALGLSQTQAMIAGLFPDNAELTEPVEHRQTEALVA